MRGDIPPLPQYAFMAWCSVKTKHRGSYLNFATLPKALLASYEYYNTIQVSFPMGTQDSFSQVNVTRV
jgi:hypothetical protein